MFSYHNISFTLTVVFKARTSLVDIFRIHMYFKTTKRADRVIAKALVVENEV